MDPKQTRTLGQTDVHLTQLGFGGAAIGELWDPINEAQAQATLSTFWEAGMRYFDTSPWYGRGLSEHRIGHSVRQHSRNDYVISTKVGRLMSAVPDENDLDRSTWAGGLSFHHRHDYSYDGIMRSFEDSLQRLGVPRVDVLLIHDLDHWHHQTDARVGAYMSQLFTSGYRALTSLKDQGLIKGIGAGINQPGTINQFMDMVDLDFFLIALCYTLLDQVILDDEMARASEIGMGFIIGGVLNSGILGTGAVDDARYNYAPATQDALDRTRRIEAVCARYDIPLVAAALQFPLGHPNVPSVIPGALSPAQVTANTDAMKVDIPKEFWSDLKTEGILPDHVPTP